MTNGRTAALEPLKFAIYRRFWLSSTASNFGGQIQTVAAAWMMTALTGDAKAVALVQTAATLPMMMISLPSGALADIYERRSIMLVAQVGMLLVSLVLTALTLAHLTSPWILLAATFLIGCGTALHSPSWQASVADQVPRGSLQAAVSLNSVGFNTARSLGPAIGGFLVAAAGVAAAFAVNAFSYLGIIATLLTWKKPPPERLLPPEGVVTAISDGVRFVALSPSLVAVAVRAGIFGLCGSSVWALTAVLARDVLSGGPAVFGLLLGGFGLGAVAGALARAAIPMNRNRVVNLCSLAFGAGAILLGVSKTIFLSIPLMMIAGASWVMTLSTLSVTVQIVAPRWVVGRSIAINQVMVFAGMAAGSFAWGIVAARFGVETAFLVSGGAMIASVLLGLRFSLPEGEDADLTPHLPGPVDLSYGPVGPRDGPIVVTVEYEVKPENFAAFVEVMEEIGRMRRRNGAHRWTLHQDVEQPTRWMERFHSLTWLEHLRRQTRSTKADHALRHRVDALHEGKTKIRRLLERRISTNPIPVPSQDSAEE